MENITKNNIKNLKVSSVSRNSRSIKGVGKHFIFDDSEETCWSSDEGSPQWIWIEFKEPQEINGFSIQFQGGFAGQNCRVELTSENEVSLEPFYPENVSSMQDFKFSKPILCNQIKYVFEDSTDFFGRVIVYSIKFY